MSQGQMTWQTGLLAIAVALTLAACETRSISNSGYGNGYSPYNPTYKGELTELDVLGIDPAGHVDEAKIGDALAAHRRIVLRKGTSVVLVQSGAMLPDETMVRALSGDFNVQPFSGVPQKGADYAKALRLAAARAGAEAIVCYWGIVESGVDREGTKAVSWIPIVGTFIPDETQHVRIRLKVAVIDVRTGDWTIFAPESQIDSTLSANLNRGASDQRQVLALKEAAYKAAAAQLVASYAP